MQAAGFSPLPPESPSLEVRKGSEGKQVQNWHRDRKMRKGVMCRDPSCQHLLARKLLIFGNGRLGSKIN